MKWLCLLPVLALLSTSSAKRSFIFTGPKLYDVGKTETLILHLYDVKESGNVKIRMVNTTGDEVYKEVTVPIKDGQSTSVEFPVPSNLPKDLYRARLEVDGLLGDYRINKSQEVEFRTPKPLVFVNTDKPLYKAGQTVNIRVLVTNEDLRPYNEAKEGQIWVTDPKRVRIAQWLNVSFSEGLVHEKLPLPEEPSLGHWYIEAKIDDRTYSKLFEVKEYVLPPFEVKITPPPYILFYAKNATWEVCAEYTYGKAVKGELLTKLTLAQYYWERNRKVPTIENTTDIKGCAKVTIPIEELRSHDYYSYRSLEFYAEVTEEGTGTKMNSTSTTTPTDAPYTIKRIEGQHPRYFRPGIPLKMAMSLKTPDSKPLPDELVQVCMEAVSKKWNDMNTLTDAIKVCKNYTSDEDGDIQFTIPPQDPNTVSVGIKVEAVNPEAVSRYRGPKPSDSFTLSPWFSTSGNQIQLQRITKIDCTAIGPDVKVTIPFHIAHTDAGIRKIHYQVTSRGDIVTHGDFDIKLEPETRKNVTDDTYLPDHRSAMCADSGFQWENEVKPANYLSQNYLLIKFEEKMTPKVRILLYMVTDDGDIVADSVSYDTDICFANKVEMKFAEEKQSPGAKATIHLTAEPESLCSVGIVDKSMYILHKGDLLSESQISNYLLPLDTPSYTFPDQRSPDYSYCSKKQPGYVPVGYLDAISAFSDNGGLVLSDLPLETRPCQPLSSGGCSPRPPVVYDLKHQPAPVAMQFSGAGGLRGGLVEQDSPIQSTSEPVTTVRTDFPDTWLFELYKVGDKGSLEVEQKMPDSITEWQGEAVCIHTDKGLGLSKSASIVAFQPFFASLTLPYSVIRNEVVPIIVTVFNYLKECLPIQVQLEKTEHFQLYNGTLTKNICVCGDDSTTVYFHVRPGKLGTMNVTVTAETIGDKDICGNSDAALDVKRSDKLTKSVMVEAEGFMKEEIFNSYFCLTDEEDGSFKTEHQIKLPKSDLVPDSSRAYTSVSGDLMGPTLEGLDRLIRMPTGCGEQNMIGLVPNIVVLDYLNARKKLPEKTKQKAIANIEKGHRQQQKYRHPDGSYSAFGDADKEGSMWLTAFVVRSFASASRYVNIDKDSLKMSRNWILSQQMENGCFPMVGTVHHKAMKGGVSKEDETTSTLTAYILISILESGEMDGNAVASAIRCIEAKSKPTNYSMSLFAYATALAKHPSSANYLERLISEGNTDGGHLYWNDSDKSIAVETASYAILALLQSEKKEDFPRVASIAMWLARQRNSYGGFYSTQDTVMALQALGKYGSIVTREPPKMGISVKTDKVDEMFQVSPENELLMQRTNLKLEDDQETSVEILASGSGCALVQTSLRYNVLIPEPSEDFVLSVQTKRKSEDGCADVQIQICAGYNHPDGSNMAITEVKMVTGYSPIIDTVKELLQLKEPEIKRYEFKEDTNTLYLYISTLTQNVTCFSFDVTQEIKVLDVKPSVAKVYDYYDEGKSKSVPYSIEETCTE